MPGAQADSLTGRPCRIAAAAGAAYSDSCASIASAAGRPVAAQPASHSLCVDSRCLSGHVLHSGSLSALWQRRRQASKQAAVEWEHRFLSQFDYAWNRRCNAAARHVALRQVRAPGFKATGPGLQGIEAGGQAGLGTLAWDLSQDRSSEPFFSPFSVAPRTFPSLAGFEACNRTQRCEAFRMGAAKLKR